MSSITDDAQFEDLLASLDPERTESAGKDNDNSDRPGTSLSDASSVSSKRALGLQRCSHFTLPLHATHNERGRALAHMLQFVRLSECLLRKPLLYQLIVT